MLKPTLWNVAAWVAWGILIVSIRYSAELRSQLQMQEKILGIIDDSTQTEISHV
jgi:heme exporter protein C